MKKAAQGKYFYNGQLLRARDLRDDFQTESQLRWWHTVGFHNTWGIAEGLTVSTPGDDQGLYVAPGLAYDCHGRELLLSEPEWVRFPTGLKPFDGSTRFDLVMSYDNQPGGQSRRMLDPVCPGHGTGGTLDRPIFAWRRPEFVRHGREISLVRISLIEGSHSFIDHKVRRYVRPMTRPYLAVGRTPSGIPWKRWPDLESDRHFGWAVEVDTSEAGFNHIPHYFATFVSDPLASKPDLDLSLLAILTSVARPRRKGFTFAVLLAVFSEGARGEDFSRTFDSLTPAVTWLGVEPVQHCVKSGACSKAGPKEGVRK